ncbi:glycoside hydrolase [Vararia minispora EC-137]|uniref:Glycoside hydrolase n=1 Tax=Vararia minispora EC-137 TaxID=1314806 RepID=A0ACB8QWL6_9AGAM|nr:glycoside hydrolase [Vararia minispora EC-137]
MGFLQTAVFLLACVSRTVYAQVTVTINVGQTFQTIDGFGFSQAFGRANDIKGLPAASQKQALDFLFNTTSGAGMTILRNRIGSGGSGDSIEPKSPGSPSATPTYVWDDNDTGQVWFSQQAQSYGVTTFYADPWSAPGFMKTNGNEANGGYLCGVTGETCSSGDWRQAYANFLVQYVEFYAQAGIQITHLGMFNEPDFTATYSSMLTNGQQAVDVIKTLSSTVKSVGLNVQLACCDATGWNAQTTLTNAIVAAGAESDLGIFTSHGYSSAPSMPMKTTRRVWQTENADLSGSFSPNNWFSSGAAGEGLSWANNIYQAIVSANCSAYLYWEALGGEIGTTNSALVLVSGTTPQASKRLWAFAQWSRFVRPGAVRLGTSITTSGNLKFSAFKNPDGTVSVQAINTGSSASTVNVATSGFTLNNASAVVSQQGTDFGSLSVTVNGGQATASVPAHSMVTFVLNGSVSIGNPGGSGGGSNGGSPACTTAQWGQGARVSQSYSKGFTGCTTCATGFTCTVSNAYYSQCL